MDYKKTIRDFAIPKIKFAATSSIATLVDYGLYISLTMLIHTSETIAHGISYSVAMILNFLLQRKFIFASKRKTSAILAMSVMFSLIGWLLSQAIFNLLIFSIPFFRSYDLVAKIITTASIFLYNFYTKRFSFERKYPLQGAGKHLKRRKVK